MKTILTLLLETEANTIFTSVNLWKLFSSLFSSACFWFDFN